MWHVSRCRLSTLQLRVTACGSEWYGVGLAVVGGSAGWPGVVAGTLAEKMALCTVCLSSSVPRFSCDEMLFMKLNRCWLDGVLDWGDWTLEEGEGEGKC